jgi:hypothetical protein
MIEEKDIEQSIENLRKVKDVVIVIELSVYEAFCLIVAVQHFKVTHGKLESIAMVAELATLRLQEKLGNECFATYRVLNEGWKLISEPPKKDSNRT